MFKKKTYKLFILFIGIVGIAILTGCHATQSSYMYNDYNYPYPPYYYAYYPYPYYYPTFFFGTDLLIIHSNQQVISSQRGSSGPHGRILMGGSLGSGTRGLSKDSSTGRRRLD